jgi:hypothetical protein
MVSNARKRLFGSWEMNWMAYNYAHDIALPGSAKQPLVYISCIRKRKRQRDE